MLLAFVLVPLVADSERLTLFVVLVGVALHLVCNYHAVRAVGAGRHTARARSLV